MNAQYFISFYTWWEPEKSSDEALRRSLTQIKGLGFNNISFDISYDSYKAKASYWGRVMEACREVGLKILPVVTYGFLPGASVLEGLVGLKVSRAVACDGEQVDCINTCDEGNVEPLALFIERLMEDLGDVVTEVDGKPSAIIWEPSMVLWGKGIRRHLGYDEASIKLFKGWLEAKYGSLEKLNSSWGSSFKGFEEARPPPRGIWEGERRIVFMEHNRAWDDFCLFRAGLLARFYGKLASRLKTSNIAVLIGLNQHGVAVQHDSFHHRCIYLPFWREVPAERFIASADLYCKSPSEVKVCLEAELSLFKKYFNNKVSAYITPIEALKLVESPKTLADICEEMGAKEINIYAWNEMSDGANIRDHMEIWEEIRLLLK